MADKILRDEKALIDKILERRKVKSPRMSAETMTKFKEQIGEEIRRTGSVSEDFVQQLLRNC